MNAKIAPLGKVPTWSHDQTVTTPSKAISTCNNWLLENVQPEIHFKTLFSCIPSLTLFVFAKLVDKIAFFVFLRSFSSQPLVTITILSSTITLFSPWCLPYNTPATFFYIHINDICESWLHWGYFLSSLRRISKPRRFWSLSSCIQEHRFPLSWLSTQ